MMAGRVLHAGLQLLDRQLLDRENRRCGKVDDLELTRTDDGTLYVSAIFAGPGELVTRMHMPKLGDWIRNAVLGDRAGATRIPFENVRSIDNHIALSMDDNEVATFATERWFRDHITARIPGSRHEPDE
jgi:sporulation protein YlmC with PRC-barrel domain